MPKAPITHDDIIKISRGYHREHGVKESDVMLANVLREALEGSRRDTPVVGDIIICRGDNDVVYEKGHLDRGDLTAHSAICVRPSNPFVFFRKGEAPALDTSGGYWFSADENTKPVYKGQAEKTFKAWGHCGACGDGAFSFTATVNVWEIYSKSVY